MNDPGIYFDRGLIYFLLSLFNIKNMRKPVLLITLLFCCIVVFAQQSSFKIIPLGVKGGADEANLSAYMIAATGTDNYVCLDAGTLHAGLEKAVSKHLLKSTAENALKNNIKSYLISHGHLDHLAGLVLNSPDDSKKNIYVMPYVKDVLSTKYFIQGSWSNFSDEGEKAIGRYHYVTLEAGKEIGLAETNMYVTAFPLSHGTPYKSTAFLIRSNESYLLYFGDTGPDEIEHSTCISDIWKAVAPLIKAKKLKAIFLECSFPDTQADDKLFGHLTPKWLMKEMDALGALAGNENVKGLSLVITHIKPGGDHEAIIRKEIKAENKLKLKVVFAQQARELIL